MQLVSTSFEAALANDLAYQLPIYRSIIDKVKASKPELAGDNEKLLVYLTFEIQRGTESEILRLDLTEDEQRYVNSPGDVDYFSTLLERILSGKTDEEIANDLIAEDAAA